MLNSSSAADAIPLSEGRQRKRDSCGGVGEFIFDRDCTIRSCNDIFSSWLGMSFQQIVGRKVTVSLPAISLPFVPTGNSFNATATQAPGDLKLFAADGVEIAPVASFDVLPMDNDCLLLVVIECGKSEHARKRSMEDFILGAILSTQALAVTDACGRIEFVNDAFEAMTGFCHGEIVGKHWDEWLPELEPVQNPPHWLPNPNGRGGRKRISIHRKKNGEMLYLLQESRWFVDGDGMPSHIVFEGRDISSTVVSWRKIRYLADYDSLTGLTSRAHTLDHLQQEILQAESNKSCFAIAIADVNEFKLVNDQYGHGVGDIVLRDVAKRIKGSLNDGCIVGRLSGDEFLIIFSNVSTLEEAEEQKEKIKDAFAERMIVDDNDIALSVSIGVALYPEHGVDDKALLEYADLHMYLDKEQRGAFSSAGRKYRGGRSVQCDV